ncbi:MAG: diadenylate cyclase CdaA [Planctomycetes bacterium]|nr:diadenylate cyclase CdaA [Planctomycetota bacterium]
MFATQTLWTAVEIFILFVCFYGILVFLRGTRGSGIIKGLFFFLIMGFILTNVMTRLGNLPHLNYVFQNLVTLAAIFMIVVFQPEIRRGLMKIGQNPLVAQFLHTDPGFIPEVVRAVRNMSREKIGALVAIEREADIRSVTEGGVFLDAEVKSELLETIFWPGSALHDGGALIQNGRVSSAGCIFPLTENPQVSRRLGTRHRAAIGISEETDAIAVIVSEETGAISLAHGGKLFRRLHAEEFEQLLRELLTSRPPGGRKAPATVKEAG